MKLTVLAASILLIGAASPSAVRMSTAGAFKDRAAMILYEGRSTVIAFVPYADSANLVLIVLDGFRGDSVRPAQLAGRPCVGVALFSKAEWSAIMATGRKAEDVKPGESAKRIRLYPAAGSAPPAGQDIATGEAWVSLALQGLDSVPKLREWSVRKLVDNAKGPCTAE